MNGSQKSKEAQGFRELRTDGDSLLVLLETIACGILTVDIHGQIAYTNNSACRMLGKSREELTGRAVEILDWHHPDGSRVAPEDLPFAVVLQSGKPSAGQIYCIPNVDTHETFFVSVNVVPLRDRQKKICGAAADFVDITDAFRFRREREQLLGALKESEARYRMLAETAPVGVFECDGEGSWLYLNPHWTSISGRDTEESLGLGWIRAIHPEDLDRALRDFRAPAGPAVAESEYRLLHPSGKTVWVRMLRQPVSCEGNNPSHFVGIVSDITVHKDAQRLLQRAKAAAEEANQAKSRFLQVVSHEIRTPMTIFMGMLELALAGPLTAEQSSYLQTAESAADSLLTLVEDILLYADLEAGRLAMEKVEFDLPACLDGALAPAAAEARRKGIDFRLEIAADVPQKLCGDPERLRQVLVNMTGNAVRFTAAGEIRVQVSVCRNCLRNRQALRVAIYDTGLGIPTDKLEYLFRAFGQLDTSTTRRFGGTGLGLAISKGIVEAMQGEVRVESIDGKGSIFSFAIPLSAGEVCFY